MNQRNACQPLSLADMAESLLRGRTVWHKDGSAYVATMDQFRLRVSMHRPPGHIWGWEARIGDELLAFQRLASKTAAQRTAEAFVRRAREHEVRT